jgi:hypothetical protein
MSHFTIIYVQDAKNCTIYFGYCYGDFILVKFCDGDGAHALNVIFYFYSPYSNLLDLPFTDCLIEDFFHIIIYLPYDGIFFSIEYIMVLFH